MQSTDPEITIHYNDQMVHLNAHRRLAMRWSNGPVFDKNKSKQNTAELPKANFKMIKNEKDSSPAHGDGKINTFTMPPPYVQYDGQEEDYDDRNEVEYDLDREDIEWLRLINDIRERLDIPQIEEHTLEQAIDLLEKESHFQFAQSGQAHSVLPLIDNDASCCICNDAEDSNANQIIFCDMCNIAVHQECYGVPYIPEGQWLCRRCQLSPSVSVRCELCPFTTGAFKQTADGRWAHVICAIWLNEVHFANTVFLEPIEGVDHSLRRRHKLKCRICKKKVGACLQCSNRTCSRSFHVTCGYYAGMRMEVNESQNKKKPETVIVNRFVYCHQHSKNGQKNDESMASWKREIEHKSQEARKKLNDEKKETSNSVPVPVIPREKIEEIARSLNIEDFSCISAYWSMKRQSRSGVPLIRRLQVYFGQRKPIVGKHFLDTTSPNQQPGPSRTSSSRSHHADSSSIIDLDPLVKFTQIRRTFERARIASEQVMKREKLKLQVLEEDEEFASKMKPSLYIMRETLDKLVEKDHEKIFRDPVDEHEVPGYHAVITQPMDFQRMRQLLESGKYKRMADLHADFNLMMQNCATFNRDNRYFYNYGQRIKRIGSNVIKYAEEAETKLNQILPEMMKMTKQLDLMELGQFYALQAEYFGLQEQQPSSSNAGQSVKPAGIEEKQITKPSSIRRKSVSRKQSTVDTENPGKRRKISLKSDAGEQSSKQRRRKSSTIRPHPSLALENITAKMEEGELERSGTPMNSLNQEGPMTPTNPHQLLSRTPTTPPRRPSTNSKKRSARRLTMDNDDDSYKGQGMPKLEESETAINQNQKKNSEVTPRKATSFCGNKKNRTNTTIFPHASRAMEDVTKPTIPLMVSSARKNILQQSTTIHKQPSYVSERFLHLTNGQQKHGSQPCKTSNSGRGVDKRTYVNSYLTEASSAADDSDEPIVNHIDFDASPSVEEDTEYDELPVIPSMGQTNLANNQKLGNRRSIQKRVGVPMPTDAFNHNDIVIIKSPKGCQIPVPGRVIDLRMHFDFDLEDSGNNGLSSDFIRRAKTAMPKCNSGGLETLVLFFDDNNTWNWIPTDQLTLYIPEESHCNQLSKFYEAFNRARQFMKNVSNSISPIH